MGPGAKVAANTVAGVLGVLCLLSFVCAGCLLPLDFLFTLVAGWGLYLIRVVPQITWNWSGFLTALVCLLALTFGLQWFLRWFYRQLQLKRTVPSPRDWSWAWTMRILILVVLMFVAGISAVGVTHQTAGLFTSPVMLWEGGFHEAASRIQSLNNMKQIGLACHNYHDTFSRFPPGATFDSQGRMMHGWQTRLLPFIEKDALYSRINFKVPWNDPDNAGAFAEIVREYENPGLERQDKTIGLALSHYAGNARVLGGEKAWRFSDITDGASNTLLAGEAAGNFKPWGYPANWRDPALGINTAPGGFGGPWKSKGANFTFADGSARFIKDDIDPATLKALSTPDGGESLKDADF